MYWFLTTLLVMLSGNIAVLSQSISNATLGALSFLRQEICKTVQATVASQALSGVTLRW